MSTLFFGVLFISMLPTVDGVFSKVCFDDGFKERKKNVFMINKQ
jgi:hypothetical protein